MPRDIPPALIIFPTPFYILEASQDLSIYAFDDESILPITLFITTDIFAFLSYISLAPPTPRKMSGPAMKAPTDN